MDGQVIVAARHDLWRVEQLFRMANSDLKVKPIFHRTRDSIEAHLTIVFAALAIARYLQNRTGMSIKKIVRPLGPTPSSSTSTVTNSPPAHPWTRISKQSSPRSV